ncbi:MAG: 5'-methylthioadenosine/S-adenosylhomocysteine nucleosidase [Eubacterium sp.]|nr:5'-methylthioadenosine/S-adenosylhomocysteine nucleosidase [Eubacterium sp.]
MKLKKLVCLVLITVMGCMLLNGCGNNNAASKDKYGIITSSDAQAEQIKKKMKVEDKKEVADMTFYLGTMKDQNVVLVKNEIGKVNTATATQILLDKFGATKIIEANTFVSLKEECKEGSILVATETIQSDFDATGAGYAPAEIPATGLGAFATDVELHKTALDVAKKTVSADTVLEVSVCSGDKYELTQSDIDKIVEDHNGDVYDMDSAALGQVCYLNGIPYIIVGSVSTPDAPADATTEIVEKIVGTN